VEEIRPRLPGCGLRWEGSWTAAWIWRGQLFPPCLLSLERLISFHFSALPSAAQLLLDAASGTFGCGAARYTRERAI